MTAGVCSSKLYNNNNNNHYDDHDHDDVSSSSIFIISSIIIITRYITIRMLKVCADCWESDKNTKLLLINVNISYLKGGKKVQIVGKL